MNYYDQFSKEEKEELNRIIYVHDRKLDLVNKAIEIYLRHNKESILKEFAKKLSKQKDIDPKIVECVNEHFWDLVREEPAQPEEPQIIGNVMKWEGENYLAFPNQDRGLCDCVLCALGRKDGNFKNFHCSVNCPHFAYFKNFKDIEITDELATMRTKENPIYIKVGSRGYHEVHKLLAVTQKSAWDISKVAITYSGEFKIEECRLATYDEIKECLGMITDLDRFSVIVEQSNLNVAKGIAETTEHWISIDSDGENVLADSDILMGSEGSDGPFTITFWFTPEGKLNKIFVD